MKEPAPVPGIRDGAGVREEGVSGSAMEFLDTDQLGNGRDVAVRAGGVGVGGQGRGGGEV